MDTRIGKDACATPTLSTSHNFSSVKGSLKDSQCRSLRPRKLALDRKLEAYREALHGKFAIRKLGANNNAGAAVQSPSLMSSLTPDVVKLMELAQNNIIDEDEMLLSPLGARKVELGVKVGGKRKLQSTMSPLPPYSPAQTLLMFQLDRKRKRSAGLPSLAFDCTGCPAATHGQLKARTPLERPRSVSLLHHPHSSKSTGNGKATVETSQLLVRSN